MSTVNVRVPATIRSKTLDVNHGLTPLRLLPFIVPALIIIAAAAELAWTAGRSPEATAVQQERPALAYR